MFFKRRMQLFESLRRNPLAQQLFPARVPNRVNDQAAQRRTARGQQYIQRPAGMVRSHISAHDHIQGQADGAAIQCRDGKDPPDPQRLEDRPEKCGVAGEDVLEGVQGV